MAKFNLPKPQVFKPSKSLQSKGGFGGGDTTVNNTNYYSSGLLYAYNENTTPGSGASPGAFCFNSLTAGSITKCYVSTLDQDGVDRTASLARMTSGDMNVYSPAGGVLQFSVSRMVAQSGYYEFDVDHLAGALPSVGNQYVDFVADAPGVRVYRATISQTGTSAPVASGVVNSTALTPSYSFSSTGMFNLSLPGLPSDATKVKAFLVNGNTASPSIVSAAYLEDTETIEMVSWNAAGSLTNGLLIGATLTIEILP